VPTPNGANYIGLFHGSARAVATGKLFADYAKQTIKVD
jgi:hypothetical protein